VGAFEIEFHIGDRSRARRNGRVFFPQNVLKKVVFARGGPMVDAGMMTRLFAPLAFAALVLTGCSTLEMPGSTTYFANQPGGQPFFKVSSGLGAPSLAVRDYGGKWTKSQKMEPLKPTDPPLSTTPGLAVMVESGYSIDSYAFLKFKPGSTASGKPVPSLYFLYPGGFAYPVPAP
jgi:hypothetical protein